MKKTLFLLFAIIFDKTVCQAWVYDDYGCKTPTGGIGQCMVTQECKPIINLMQKLQKPISPNIAKELRKYYCGAEDGKAKVCCPSTPLVVIPNMDTFTIEQKNNWLIEDEETCRTPDNFPGNCVILRECRPMVNFFESTRKPFPQYVIDGIRKYTCGYEGNAVRVCCPDAPIRIRPPTRPTSAPVSSSPPDVSNHRNFNLLPVECGKSGSDDKIINGQDANLLEFPWMALISYNTQRRGPQFKCGGSIINNRYILTAAHCITNLNEPLLGVRLGEYDIRNRTDCQVQGNNKRKCTQPVQDVGIEEIIPHPAYDPNVISNDIGLLRVSRMNLNAENVKPICLPTDETARNAKFNNTIVSGWGFLDNLGTPSYILQRVDLPYVNRQDCQNAYLADRRVKITEKQICAGGKNNQDSCPGDSGGPMQLPGFINDDIRYIQYGVVSFGPRECGLAGYPGVYTKIAYYMDWILDNIKP